MDDRLGIRGSVPIDPIDAWGDTSAGLVFDPHGEDLALAAQSATDACQVLHFIQKHHEMTLTAAAQITMLNSATHELDRARGLVRAIAGEIVRAVSATEGKAKRSGG